MPEVLIDPRCSTAKCFRIPGAQFVSLPGLIHPAALWRSDLVLPTSNRFGESDRALASGDHGIFQAESRSAADAHATTCAAHAVPRWPPGPNVRRDRSTFFAARQPLSHSKETAPREWVSPRRGLAGAVLGTFVVPPKADVRRKRRVGACVYVPHRSMFLRDSSPKPWNSALIRPLAASRTAREIKMPPGGASPSRRTAMLTASP